LALCSGYSSPQRPPFPTRRSSDLTLPNPGGGAMKLDAAGNAHVDLGKQTVSSALKGKLDDSSFDAKLGLAQFSSPAYTFDIGIRSEEHTSELQSRGHLVCRLLLVK